MLILTDIVHVTDAEPYDCPRAVVELGLTDWTSHEYATVDGVEYRVVECADTDAPGFEVL